MMRMNEPLENTYFNWLCAKVINIRNNTPSTTYWTLLKTLHETEYVWLLSGDDNRAMDGMELREYFLTELDLPDEPEWRKFPGCSLLEMFIAFAYRAEFQTNGISGETASDWFWEFMDNLGLKELNDASGATPEEIGEKVYNFIWRTYDPSGKNGGLFPLERPHKDQRNVQIVYQFFAYLEDQDRMA
jgi:hypothetical protein